MFSKKHSYTICEQGLRTNNVVACLTYCALSMARVQIQTRCSIAICVSTLLRMVHLITPAVLTLISLAPTYPHRHLAEHSTYSAFV